MQALGEFWHDQLQASDLLDHPSFEDDLFVGHVGMGLDEFLVMLEGLFHQLVSLALTC